MNQQILLIGNWFHVSVHNLILEICKQKFMNWMLNDWKKKAVSILPWGKSIAKAIWPLAKQG